MAVMAKKASRTPAPAPEPPANPWPARLAALRSFYNEMTQEQAAAKLPVSKGTWRHWEQGRIVPPEPMQHLIELVFPEFFKK